MLFDRKADMDFDYRSSLKILIFTIFCVTVYGCSATMQPIKPSRAQLGTKTPMYEELKSLPEPREKLVAAVYRFRDQTGQYKASETVASWSTAVTQGATSILLRALEDSGWFIPIEREGLSNLLNERQIIRQLRQQHSGPGGEQLPPLPPLLYAGIMLEGGIVSYDTNVLTGGAGVRYFGAGGSGQYRIDQVTIYLRATSTQSGRILKTVYTTKTIISQMVDVGLFRFVEVKRLLEAEAGYSFNEPPVLAVTEAIEKAVQSLIIEGVFDGLWELQDPRQINSDIIRNYRQERKDNVSIDYLGRLMTERRARWGLSINTGPMLYKGDYPDPLMRPSWDAGLKYAFDTRFSLGFHYGRGQLATNRFFESSVSTAEVYGQYYLNPLSRFTPFLVAGTGALINETNTILTSSWISDIIDETYMFISAGVGLEFLLDNRVGLNLMIKNNYMLNDHFDGVRQGKYNDYFWRGRVGVTYYLGM
jgi:curli production assembly/transport component CsgG